MEDSEKVEENFKEASEDDKKESSEEVVEKSSETEVSAVTMAVAEDEVKADRKVETIAVVPASEVIETGIEEQKDPIEVKIVEIKKAEQIEEDELPPRIEECDTGGDEVPDVAIIPEPTTQAVELFESVTPDPEKGKTLLTELRTVVQPVDPNHESDTNPVVESTAEKRKTSTYVVAIDDDDDDDVEDDDDDDDDNDDDDDDGDEDIDDDDDGISNEAMNDDDEVQDLYEDDNEKSEKNTLSRELLVPHPIDDFYDDDDMDDDDEDLDDMKDNDDSSAAVVIGSSDEDEVHVHRQTSSIKRPSQTPARKYADIDDLDFGDEDDDDDDDDYDDDDLMNAVVTSATKGLTSPAAPASKKGLRLVTPPNEARQREADQISVLSRRSNYGKIAKKKSLHWLYNKRKRQTYKELLRKRLMGSTLRDIEASSSFVLKVTKPNLSLIAAKSPIKPTTSTPTVSKLVARAIKTQEKEECVIDLDSSPEKVQENPIPRNQSDDDHIKLEIGVKKPPDHQDHEETEKRKAMQQTDKVRDTIQKSPEEVEEVKSVARLSCEQNKENLQSNEALKKEKNEAASKHETETKNASPSEEAMDTNEETNDSTLKAPEFLISSVTSFKVDIKEEKVDGAPTSLTPPPPGKTTEPIVTSKDISPDDVPDKEYPKATSSPHPVSVGASKRRRSSSTATQDKCKTSRPTSSSAAISAANQDDDEEYIHPTKKLREELQSNYPAHNRILNEYIEKTSNDSIDTIQRHIEQMLSEIQTLNEMIKAKEVEWNNMLHLKKVKEEICVRLTRRKQCMEIMATKVGEAGGNTTALDEDYLANVSALAFGKTTPSQINPQLSSTPISAAINSLNSNICNFTAVSSSSSAAPTTAQLIVQNRANMKSSDLVKEKANTQRLHRNILPKPIATSSPASVAANNNQQQSPSVNGPTTTTPTPSASNQPILNSYLTSADSVQQLVDIMNGHHNSHNVLHNGGASGVNNSQAAAAAAMVGRQGPFRDVRSIIADFRQQHPEVVPRRGRRVKNSNNSNLSDSNTILGNALKSDTNSRPSSNDSSSHSLNNTNQTPTNHSNINSFKDVLAPFAKSQAAASLRSAGGPQQQNPPYPEVTLHPVSTPLNASGGQDQPTGSLLHGILTKFSRPNEPSASTKSVTNQTLTKYDISNFSPTLARLLTAPERISASGAGSSVNTGHHASVGSGDGGSTPHHTMPGFGVNLSKVVGHNSEITITPVMNSMHQQSMLQQQLQQQQLKEVISRAAAAVSGGGNSGKDDHFLKLSSFAAASAANDDDAEDSVDRLVIDEGVDTLGGNEEHQRIAPHSIGQEFNENEVPVCQGCKKHEAQFVCAGCGNQWYCSRECQVTAWDDHSEVCTATKQIRNKFCLLKSKDLVREDEYFIVRRRKRNKLYPQFY